MICIIFFLALSWISSAKVITPLKDNGITNIQWTSANSSDGIPNLSINFRDGRQYEAVLKRLDLFSEEIKLSGLSSDHLCIFEGSLENDLGSRILLTGGCPGSNSFEITTTGKVLGSLKLNVVAGVVTENRSFRDEFHGRLDAIETTDAQRHSKSSATRAYVPLPGSGFVYRIGIVYDTPWLQTHGSHAESINAAARVVAQGQVYFYWPSLTVPFKLQIASITYKNARLTMGSGLDVLIPLATDRSINTYVGMTTAEGGGVAYGGTICGEMKYRTALIGKPAGTSEALAGEVLGHELGHSLGAPHDFIDPHKIPKTIRYDSTGRSCTNINSLMDYDKTYVALWSRCTVEKITENYNNIIAAQGKFCMTQGGSCVAIPPWNSMVGMIEWCNTNCNHKPPYCPTNMCKC